MERQVARLSKPEIAAFLEIEKRKHEFFESLCESRGLDGTATYKIGKREEGVVLILVEPEQQKAEGGTMPAKE